MGVCKWLSMYPLVLSLLLLGVTTITARNTNGRIVGGEDLEIHNSPWQASIQISGRHVCGAVIYSQEIVLTAGHCVDGKSLTLMQVRVGTNQHLTGGTFMPVKAYKIHELYNSKYLHYDLAVVRLSTSLTFTLSVKAINLASESPKGGALASVSGWGYMQQEEGSYAKTLQSVQLKIIEREECASSKYGYGEDFVGSETICAAQAKKDACTGDSGGPLVSNRLLVGIVSWGYGCALDNYPGVYADVAKLRPWIIQAANAV